MKSVGPLYDWTSAIADSDLAPTSRHVALTFALHLNRRDRSAFPGAAKLADETGLHLSTVKRALADLEARGWLVCEQRGGSLRGGRRLATVWSCAIPDDPTGSAEHRVQTTTGSPERADRSSCAREPVAQSDPNYPENYPGNHPPGGDSLRSTPTEPTLDLSDIPPAARGEPTSPSSLVAGYIDDVVALTGSRPPSSWIAAAGKAIKRAEAEGFTRDEIALALGDRARRNGNPGGLLNALMDLRRDLHTSGAGR